jgi:hypothetical protein
MIVLSGMDAYCIGKNPDICAADLACAEALDKHMDYNLSLEKYPVMRYCLPRVGTFSVLADVVRIMKRRKLSATTMPFQWPIIWLILQPDQPFYLTLPFLSPVYWLVRS